MKKTKVFSVTTIVLSVLLMAALFSSCAVNEVVTKCVSGHTYGFWGGLWHGLIAPFDLIGMLFRKDVTMYAQNNNGVWYAFGFLLGSGGWGLWPAHAARIKNNMAPNKPVSVKAKLTVAEKTTGAG